MRKSTVLILLGILLASCGGGGGSGVDLGNIKIDTSNISVSLPNVTLRPSKEQQLIENRKSSTEKVPTDERDYDASGLKVLVMEPQPEEDDYEHANLVQEVLTEEARVRPILKGFDDLDYLERFKEGLEAVKDQDIILVNNSYGTDGEYDTEEIIEETKGDIQELKRVIGNKKSLFVWANGNEKKDYPDLEARLPMYMPSLESNWISAVGIKMFDENQKKIGLHYPEHLSYPGEKAKWWSISADASIDEDDDENIGSSFAAPRVAAAAAIVAQKFPWMTADQIRQTLFTTTMKPELQANSRMIDLFEKLDEERISEEEMRELVRITRNKSLIPDNRYGWGILGFYIAGPGAFTNIHSDRSKSQNFIADIPHGTTSYFEHDIQGEGGLEKRGRGQLILTGNNTYKGNSKVLEGSLDIYGIHSSAIEVGRDGILRLHDKALIGYDNGGEPFIMENTISASNIRKQDVNNYGRTEIVGKHSIIGGDYNARENSVTYMDVESRLNVVGDINLERNSSLVLKADEYIPSTKVKKEIAKANKINHPENMNVETEGMLKANVVSTDDGIATIEVERENARNYVASRRESSVNTAENIERELKEIDRKIEEGIVEESELRKARALQHMSKRSFTQATKKMSGEIYASAQALTFSQNQDNNRVISNHLFSLDNVDKEVEKTKAWFSTMVSDGKIAKDGYATGDTKISGGVIGLDKKVTSDSILGAGMLYSYGKAEFDYEAGKANSQTLGIFVNGRKAFRNHTYLTGKIGLSTVNSKVNREMIDINGKNVQGKIKHRDYLLSLYMEAGKTFDWFTPYLAFSYDYLRRGSFSEENSDWGIQADSKNYVSPNLVAGMRAKYKWNSYELQSYIHHSLNIGDRNLNYEGNYKGSSLKQNYKGIDLPKHSTWLGMGVSKNMNDNFKVYLNLDTRLERKKSRNIMVSTGLEYKF